MNIRWFGLACVVALAPSVGMSKTVPELWAEFSRIRNERMDIRAKSLAIRSAFKGVMPAVVDHPENEGDENVRDVFQMLDMAHFYAHVGDFEARGYYMNGMGRIFDELVKRGAQRDSDIHAYYDGLILSRRFEEAKALLATHGVEEAPGYEALPGMDIAKASSPAAYMVAGDGRMVLSNVVYPDGGYVVVIVGCHFAEDAARALMADERLAGVMKSRRVFWLFSAVDFDPDALKAWNASFPDFPGMMAYDNATWKGVGFSETPRFHFFRDGRLVDSFSGWDRGEVLPMIENSLAKIGLLDHVPDTPISKE